MLLWNHTSVFSITDILDTAVLFLRNSSDGTVELTGDHKESERDVEGKVVTDQ